MAWISKLTVLTRIGTQITATVEFSSGATVVRRSYNPISMDHLDALVSKEIDKLSEVDTTIAKCGPMINKVDLRDQIKKAKTK